LAFIIRLSVTSATVKPSKLVARSVEALTPISLGGFDLTVGRDFADNSFNIGGSDCPATKNPYDCAWVHQADL
jgi:hypothetical protein